jgi:surface antigen
LAQASVALVVAVGALAAGVTAPDPASVPGAGSPYVPVPPHQLLDIQTSADPLAVDSTRYLTVGGVDQVAQNAVAVVLNVTASAASAPGTITVYPVGESPPTVANLSFAGGQTVSNLAAVQVGDEGKVAVHDAGGAAQLTVDAEGYFAEESGMGTAGSYVPLNPVTIADTTPGSGEPNSGSPLAPEGVLNVQVAGAGGVPLSGTEAVALEVTVTDTTESSSLTAYPAGTAVPPTSDVSWAAGATAVNEVIAPTGAGGEVSFRNAQGDADLVVNVLGYFTDGTITPASAGLFIPVPPAQALNTASSAGTLQAGGDLQEQFAGIDGISPTADAVVVALSSTNATQPTLLGITPEPGIAPTVAGPGAGQNVPTLTFASLDAEGAAGIHNAAGTADAIVDVFGYFEPEARVSPSAAAPCASAGLVTNVTTNPQGTQVTVFASDRCPAAAQVSYEYWYQPWFSSVWTLAQGWESAASYAYDTSTWAVGMYNLAVWVSTDGSYQGVAATTYMVSEPSYQYPEHVIPPESTLDALLVNRANADTLAACYSEWAAGVNCDEDGDPGQCTFWAELNWDSPYASVIHGNASELPGSYTALTGRPVATTPAVGDLAVWDGPGPYADSWEGHVAVVIAVASDGGFYTVSQMNWTDQDWDMSTMNVPFSASLAASQDLMGFLPPG